MKAAENGNLDAVRTIIDADNNNRERILDIDRPDVKGKIPLMLAAENGHKEVIEYLLEKGAIQFLVSPEGKTAYDYAKMRKQHTTANILEALVTPGSSIDPQSLAGEWDTRWSIEFIDYYPEIKKRHPLLAPFVK